MRKRIEEYQPTPTNHSTLPKHMDFMRRVVAHDLPIGFCESSKCRDFWIRLRREADWMWFSNPYFHTGKFELPPMPPGLDKETVADEITKTQQERLKMQALYGKP